VLQTEDALYRVAYELAEDAARENVRYMEVRYSPMLHTRRPRAHERRRGRARGPARGARSLRHRVATSSSAASATSRPRARSRWPSSPWPTRAAASSASTSPAPSTITPPSTTARPSSSSATTTSTCTIHAGEAYGPESIAQAIHVCGAHRIGHGCRLREDGDLLHYINDHRIPLECCPSSNVQTGAVRDLASHPLKLYNDLGLRVTINTDNRLVTDTTVSKELWLCHTRSSA
jgi:adenosine deaminase